MQWSPPRRSRCGSSPRSWPSTFPVVTHGSTSKPRCLTPINDLDHPYTHELFSLLRFTSLISPNLSITQWGKIVKKKAQTSPNFHLPGVWPKKIMTIFFCSFSPRRRSRCGSIPRSWPSTSPVVTHGSTSKPWLCLTLAPPIYDLYHPYTHELFSLFLHVPLFPQTSWVLTGEK